jgi:hypothetical protein
MYKPLVLLAFLSLPGWCQPWNHQVWRGQWWGEPAQLEEWAGPQGYQRRLSLSNFPWSEWSVLEASGATFEVDCNGRRRVLEGAARRSLYLRWVLDSKEWREKPVDGLTVAVDEQNRPRRVKFSGREQTWDYSQGVAFQETDPAVQTPCHFARVLQDGQAPPPLPPARSGPTQSVELPLSLVHQRYTQVSVVVAGQPEIFLLDSGASNNVIDRGLVAQRGWARAGRQKLTGGLFQEIGWARVPALQVGDQAVGEQNWLELDLQGSTFAQAFPNVKGILGYDFLSDYTVQFDYPQARLRLLAQGFQPHGEDQAVEARRDGTGLEVAVEVEGQKGFFTVDTGSGGGILVHHLPGQQEWVPPACRDLYDPQGAQFGSGKAGTWPGRGSFKLGPFVWNPAPLEVVDEKTAEGASLSSDGNIGVAYWQHFRMTMDLPGGRLWLAQVTPFRSPRRATFGLPLKPEDGSWKVAPLPSGGPAAQAGVLPGDVVTAVNGVPPQGMPTAAFLAGARVDEVLHLSVIRGGQVKTFALKARAIDF